MVYKVGLALAAKGGFNLVNGLVSAAASAGLSGDNDLADPEQELDRRMTAAVAASLKSCIPFQLSDDPARNSVQFLQLYAWLHAVVDVHVNAVLDALEQSGQAENTIVGFLSDHGEYGAAHGIMIEKWHAAYQEAVHVPVVVRFPEASASGNTPAAPAP
ncbi:sulfatase-like hydrolase/transferase, partial [Pseudomonas sp. GP01-A4]|uniref:sulfatase-like hydrolase/transferase n=1 Tax=Pseudomonas sp. GP01-A4 TaxID=2070571 RepID=UPI000CC2DB82